MGTEEGLKNLSECTAEIDKHVDSILSLCKKTEWGEIAQAINWMKKDIERDLDLFNQSHPDWELTFEDIIR